MDRPVTTLFMLMSVDGKISTGAADELDVDQDFPQIGCLLNFIILVQALAEPRDLGKILIDI